MSDSRSLCYIKIHDEKGTEERFFLGNRFVIGRSPETDIQIRSTEISREHLVVEVDGRDIYITDCGSSNGTFVDGAAIDPSVKRQIVPSQRLELGNKGLTLTITLFRKPVDPKLEAEEILNEAARRAEEICSDARIQAEKIQNAAQAQVQTQVSEIKSRAEQKAKDFLQQMQVQAEGLKEIAEKEAEKRKEEILDEARRQRQSAIDAIQGELDQLKKQAHLDAAAEIEALRARVLQEAQDEGAALVEKLETESRLRITEAKKKSAESAQREADDLIEKIRKQGEEESKAIEEKARKSAELVRERTEAEAEEIRAKAKSDATAILLAAKDENLRLKKINQELEERRDALEEEVKTKDEERIRIEKDRAATQTVLEETRVRVAEAKSKCDEQEHELTKFLKSIEKQMEQGRRELADQQKNLESLEDSIGVARQEHEKVNEEIQSSKDEVAELSSKISQLNNEIAQLEFRKQKTGEEVEKINRLKVEAVAKAHDDAKAVSEAAEKELIQRRQAAENEFEELKRQQELELAQMRLFQTNESARLWQEYERRLQNQKQAILEALSHEVEQIILYHVKRGGSKEADWPPPELKSEIQIAIENVIEPLLEEEPVETTVAGAFPAPTSLPIRALWVRAAALGLAMSLIFGITGILVDRQFRENPTREISSLDGKSASEIYAGKVKEDRSSGTEFKPEMDAEIKSTYADNALYTLNYLEAKLDQKVQDRWILELDRFVREDLSLNEEVIVLLIAVESRLMNQLKSLRERINGRFLEAGIQRLRDAEMEARDEMVGVLGSERLFERFLKFEQAFMKDVLTEYGRPE